MIKTQHKLYHALGTLLQQKSFESVTVSELVDAAGVTRKTFYNHYQDKIDLVQEYQAALTLDIQKIQSRHRHFDRDYFVEIFSYLDKQDILLTSLLSYNGSLELQGIIKETMYRYCSNALSAAVRQPDVLEYRSVVTANAIFGVVQHWLATGRKSTPEELAGIMTCLNFSLSDDE
jgi:AcrR family transcriptional regulator